MRWQSNPNNPLTAPPSVLRWLQICTRSSALTTTPWSIEVWSRLKAKGRWWPTFWPVDLRVNPSSQQAADTIGWVPSLSLPSSGWAGSKKLKPSAHWCFLKLEYTGVYWSMHPEDQPVEEAKLLCHLPSRPKDLTPVLRQYDKHNGPEEILFAPICHIFSEARTLGHRATSPPPFLSAFILLKYLMYMCMYVISCAVCKTICRPHHSNRGTEPLQLGCLASTAALVQWQQHSTVRPSIDAWSCGRWPEWWREPRELCV